jgi:hypothetical protein
MHFDQRSHIVGCSFEEIREAARFAADRESP